MNVTSIELHGSFVGVALQHWCSALEIFLKFYRNYFKLIWIFEYKQVQSFGGVLLEGVFRNLFVVEHLLERMQLQ